MGGTHFCCEYCVVGSTNILGFCCLHVLLGGYDVSWGSHPPLKMDLSPGKEGNSLVGLYYLHRPHISITLMGNSFSGCLFLYRGQKIAKVAFFACCFLLILMVSSWELMVFMMNFLKFSSIFPNSILLTPPGVGLIILFVGSLTLFHVLA
jgi:hypothetical protein